MNQKQTVGLEEIIGMSNLRMSPRLRPEDITARCCILGYSTALKPGHLDYVPISEIKQFLSQRGIAVNAGDEIKETLTFFGTPLNNEDYTSIVDYLKRSQEIVQSELGEVVDFEVMPVEQKRDYVQDSHKKEFLCKSLYQGIMACVHRKGSPQIKVPLVRTSPYMGAYFIHGHDSENPCEYILLCLDKNLLLASFSEPIHSIANKITREHANGKDQNSEYSLLEETFVEGVAQYLFDRHRQSLGVPSSFNLMAFDRGMYKFSSMAKKWVEANGAKAALELYRTNPKMFMEVVKGDGFL
jgi:hypothetical protein